MLNKEEKVTTGREMKKETPEIIRRYMELRGLNRSQLAKKAGLSNPTIGRILNGQTTKTQSLDKIADALGVSVGALNGEVDLDVYQLDNAPVCTDKYYLELPGKELDLPFLPQTTIQCEIVPWDHEAQRKAARVIFRNHDERKAFVATVAEVGDKVLLFPTALFSSGRHETELLPEHGQVLGAIYDVVSLSRYFRR